MYSKFEKNNWFTVWAGWGGGRKWGRKTMLYTNRCTACLCSACMLQYCYVEERDFTQPFQSLLGNDGKTAWVFTRHFQASQGTSFNQATKAIKKICE